MIMVSTAGVSFEFGSALAKNCSCVVVSGLLEMDSHLPSSNKLVLINSDFVSRPKSLVLLCPDHIHNQDITSTYKKIDI
jgi:hypothetical protein